MLDAIESRVEDGKCKLKDQIILKNLKNTKVNQLKQIVEL
jgi:hypothetical protein